MSNSNDESVTASGGFFSLLFLIFLTLKLTGVIGWSWWWVTAPLWGPISFVALVMLLIVLPLAIWKGW